MKFGKKDELLSIIKYEPYKRNKAALTLFWDLNGRNHEITILKLKHIRFREKYAEGEVPHEAKTGSGPILLTTSFPYVRDWIFLDIEELVLKKFVNLTYLALQISFFFSFPIIYVLVKCNGSISLTKGLTAL